MEILARLHEEQIAREFLGSHLRVFRRHDVCVCVSCSDSPEMWLFLTFHRFVCFNTLLSILQESISVHFLAQS